MRQHLLSFLEILDLKLLLEKFILFLLQVLSCILFGLVEILDLPLIFFTLSLMLQSDVLDSLCLLLQLINLGSDLVLVVLLTLDHVLLLRDLLRVSFDHLVLLLCQLFDLMKLVFLL